MDRYIISFICSLITEILYVVATVFLQIAVILSPFHNITDTGHFVMCVHNCFYIIVSMLIFWQTSKSKGGILELICNINQTRKIAVTKKIIRFISLFTLLMYVYCVWIIGIQLTSVLKENIQYYHTYYYYFLNNWEISTILHPIIIHTRYYLYVPVGEM